MDRRHATIIKWISLALILLGIVLAYRYLPVDAVVRAVEERVAGLGVWGPVVFGLIYVAAVLVLFPAAVLTLAAGAMFGLLIGTLTVSLASTTGAALAFLIGRYFARGLVEAKVRQSPKFSAIDKAISEGGWKVVALLRLSPAIPFNFQNYLYGLTGIRFWTCVLASWIAMLPGTFLYVYLGQIGRAGLEAAAGGKQLGAAKWTLLTVGLLATVIVTAYVSRLARKALQERAGIEGDSTPRAQP